MAEALTTESPNAVIADQGLVYCRMPGGEVIACDASDMELMKKIKRGWQVLSDYGQFGSSAYYMDHPYEPLFQAGGAHELSIAQVTSMGYHLHPPLVPTCERHVGQQKEHLVHAGRPGAATAKAAGCWRGARPAQFPQLAGLEFEVPDACEFCGRDDFGTVTALKQHQDVMHNDRRQQQQLGEAIVSGLRQTGVVSGGTDAQAIAAAVAATLQALGYAGPRRPDPGPEPDDEGDEVPNGEPAPDPMPEPEPVPGPVARRR